MKSKMLVFSMLVSHPEIMIFAGCCDRLTSIFSIITFDEVKILLRTKHSVTNIPALPGIDFGGIKKDMEVSIVSPKHGR